MGLRHCHVKGGSVIKVLKWVGRVLAIFAAVLAVVVGLAGSWGDAIYALFLAAIIWFWTDFMVARMTRSRMERAAKQSSQGESH